MRNVQSIETQRNRLTALVRYKDFSFSSVYVYYQEKWFCTYYTSTYILCRYGDFKTRSFDLYTFDDCKRTRCADCANLPCHLCITQGLSQVFEGSLYNIHNINKIKKTKLLKNENDRCLFNKKKKARLVPS